MTMGVARWFGLLSLSLSPGCAATIFPPAKLTDPVPFYLASYTNSVHSCVLLPHQGKFYDYSFGDWNYTVLKHKFITDALGALLISMESVYIRRIVPADPRTGAPVLNDNPLRVQRLLASRAAVRRRLAELTARFNRDLKLHPHGEIDSPQTGEVFVPDTQHYGLANNCNDLTAATLRALGYRVQGLVLVNRFQLAAPLKPPPHAYAANH
jgi:hypothetical protein